MMSATVYLLSAFTSLLCSALLYRNHKRSATRLLLWSSACFLFLGLNNVLLFTDLILAPATDLSAFRTIPAVLGFAVLTWGLAWET
jgi:hypothetical protein